MIKLRDYQVDTLEQTDRYFFKKGGKSGIWHIFTGGGKTKLTTHAIDRFWDPRKGFRSIIVGGVNRILTFQMLDSLREDFSYMTGNYIGSSNPVPMSGIVMGELNQTDARVVVASIQSLVGGVDLKALNKPHNPLGQPIERDDFEIDRAGNIRRNPNSKRPYLISPRFDKMLCEGGLFDVWIHDEAHHSVADGSVYVIKALDQIRQLLDLEPMRIIGNTATPKRGDDRGLHTLYETVISSYNIAYGQRHGYLVPFADPPAERIVVDELELDAGGNGSVTEEGVSLDTRVNNWAEIVAQAYFDKLAGRRTFAYWNTVEDSIHANAVFNAMGIPSSHIDGVHCIGQEGEVIHKKHARKLLDQLAKKQLQVIHNHKVLIEGVDVPEVSGIIHGLHVSADNPVTNTQLIGRCLRPAAWVNKIDSKILVTTNQGLVLSSIADLTGYIVDPTSGQFIQKLDPEQIIQTFIQLWATRQAEVELWILVQKRFKEKTIRTAIDLALQNAELEDTHLRALHDCNEYILDEDRLLAGQDLKDVKEDGKIHGINQTYELVKIVQKSSGAWYADNKSAIMSISMSDTDSFVIYPPNHTNARIAAAALQVLAASEAHPLINGKTVEQKEKMRVFFATAQRFYQSFTLWHLCGGFYNIQNKHKMWILEDYALDVLEVDALAYARDNVPNYTAAFGDKKKVSGWKNDSATEKQYMAASSVLGVQREQLPQDVLEMTKGEIAKFINHTACLNFLENPNKSIIPKLNEAIEKIKEIV